MASEAVESNGWTARKLLRAARSATLASSMEGQPFASLVIPACTAELTVLLLLSDLSEHTRHLRGDPRCSLLACGAPTEANPQTAPRVTVTGLAERVVEPALMRRFLQVHPYAALYAGFGDFAIWRIVPLNGLLVAGFARAARLRSADLRPDAGAVAALAAAEAGIIAHCNRDHADAMAAIAGRPGGWQMTAVDPDGFELTQDETVLRRAWSTPIGDAGGVRAELVRMTREARAGGAVGQ